MVLKSFCGLACALMFFQAGARELPGQQLIRGVVLDQANERPISDVSVTLLDEYDRVMSSPVRTDSAGVFSIAPRLPGRYRLRAQRIGYLQVRTPSFLIKEGEMSKFELLMSATAQILAPLTIVERPTLISNKLEGFEWRRTRNAGVFFTKEDIDRRGPLQVTDLLMNIAGMRVNENGGTTTITTIRGGSIGNDLCAPLVYIDGIRVRFDPVETLNLLDPQALYGVEVYRGPSQVPGEFSGSDAACGVIAVWTRRGV